MKPRDDELERRSQDEGCRSLLAGIMQSRVGAVVCLLLFPNSFVSLFCQDFVQAWRDSITLTTEAYECIFFFDKRMK